MPLIWQSASRLSWSWLIRILLSDRTHVRIRSASHTTIPGQSLQGHPQPYPVVAAAVGTSFSLGRCTALGYFGPAWGERGTVSGPGPTQLDDQVNTATAYGRRTVLTTGTLKTGLAISTCSVWLTCSPNTGVNMNLPTR